MARLAGYFIHCCFFIHSADLLYRGARVIFSHHLRKNRQGMSGVVAFGSWASIEFFVTLFRALLGVKAITMILFRKPRAVG